MRSKLWKQTCKHFACLYELRSSVHALLCAEAELWRSSRSQHATDITAVFTLVSPRWPIDLPVLQSIFPSKQTSDNYWWLRPHFYSGIKISASCTHSSKFVHRKNSVVEKKFIYRTSSLISHCPLLYHQNPNHSERIFKILTGRWQWMSCGT